MSAPTWLVSYDYDGGSGSAVVHADTREEATRLGMAQATPKWQPGAQCRHTSTIRWMSFQDVQTAPLAGIATAADLSWDRRDTGHEWLVIERGSAHCGGRDWWTDAGRIVGTASTLDAAQRMATAMRRCKIGPSTTLYDVVSRSDVEVVVTDQPYGCFAGGEAQR